MALKKLKNPLVFWVACFGLQTALFAAEPDSFIETVVTKQAAAGQPAVTERRLCLFNQSLKIADDVVAIVNKGNGTVMADKGKGFVTAPVGTMLKEGDRVITLDNSTAEIVFFDCCRTDLKSNNLIAVNANPGCKVAVLDATRAPPPQVAQVAAPHGASYVLPVVGAWIVYEVISAATNGFGR